LTLHRATRTLATLPDPALIAALEAEVAALEGRVAAAHYDAERNPNILDRTPYYQILHNAQAALTDARIRLEVARSS
jgi:hypothetical protein